jgi:hypothetical protein
VASKLLRISVSRQHKDANLPELASSDFGGLSSDAESFIEEEESRARTLTEGGGTSQGILSDTPKALVSILEAGDLPVFDRRCTELAALVTDRLKPGLLLGPGNGALLVKDPTTLGSPSSPSSGGGGGGGGGRRCVDLHLACFVLTRTAWLFTAWLRDVHTRCVHYVHSK